MNGHPQRQGLQQSLPWRVGFSSLSELFLPYASLNSLPGLQPHRCAAKQINKRINKISRIKSPAEVNEDSQLKFYDPKCYPKGICFCSSETQIDANIEPNQQLVNLNFPANTFFFQPDFISPSLNNISVHLVLKEGVKINA